MTEPTEPQPTPSRRRRIGALDVVAALAWIAGVLTGLRAVAMLDSVGPVARLAAFGDGGQAYFLVAAILTAASVVATALARASTAVRNDPPPPEDPPVR